MKKLTLTIAIILGMTMTTFADGGLFSRGNNAKNGASGYTYFNGAKVTDRDGDTPILPYHNETTNQDANAPVGSGIAVLAILGGAYLVGKKRREE